MVFFPLLQTLSFASAEKLLLQEGYQEEACLEQPDPVYDKVFLYPYTLYDENGKQIDRVFYAEYCSLVADDEYVDGRTTWEGIKTEWLRE